MRTSQTPGTVKARKSQACLQELEAAAALQRQLARVQNVDEHRQLVEVQRLCATAAPGGGCPPVCQTLCATGVCRLQHGATYCAAVQVQDAYGLWRDANFSSGLRVCTEAPGGAVVLDLETATLAEPDGKLSRSWRVLHEVIVGDWPFEPEEGCTDEGAERAPKSQGCAGLTRRSRVG